MAEFLIEICNVLKEIVRRIYNSYLICQDYNSILFVLQSNFSAGRANHRTEPPDNQSHTSSTPITELYFLQI